MSNFGEIRKSDSNICSRGRKALLMKELCRSTNKSEFSNQHWKRKGYAFIFVIVILTALCFSCSAQTEAQKNTKQNIKSPQTSNKNSAAENEIDISEWKTYKDSKNGFSFRYPANLIVQRKGGKVRLYHFIKYRYQDPCDMSSENSPFLNKLIDFDVTFEVINKDFTKLVKELQDTEEAPFEIPKLSGNVEGKSISHTFEFCGSYEYIYPFKKNKSLTIEDQINGYLSELAYSEARKTDAWKNPNVIKPEESARILKEILENFKIF